jgi:hypothetical protein
VVQFANRGLTGRPIGSVTSAASGNEEQTTRAED